MGLFENKCRHCSSVEHSTADCPNHRDFFNLDTECRYCESKEHLSNNCPHERGLFSSETECRYCHSKDHASKHCPHNRSLFSSETECRYCHSKDHASRHCPHNRSLFSSETECRHCGGKNHSSNNCPHNKDGNALATFFGWIIAFIVIVYAATWLFVHIVLPLAILNSALIVTVFALAKKWNKKVFAILALGGGLIMFLDIINGWTSSDFVKNVIKDKSWITFMVYTNSAVVGLNTWFLVTPFWEEAKNLEPSENQKRNILIGGTILIVAIATLIIPFLYNKAFSNLFQ